MSSSVKADPRKEQQNGFVFEGAGGHDQDNEPQLMNAPQHSGQPCMQLKGSLVPMTVLELNYFELNQFTQDLKAKTSQAPEFFENLPIVIGLEKFEEHGNLPFQQLIEACLEHSIKVVAVRGGSELLQSAAKQAGLGLLAKQKERATKNDTIDADVSAETAIEKAAQTPTINTQVETVEIEVVKTVVETVRQVSKVIHQTVRSGQQVYASDGDLIIMASVSAGAEILADGNVHVYGALRGRALAGVKGDTSARIFCHKLDAELVSVAGQYKVSEDISKDLIGKSAQIYLENDTLHFKEIEL